MADLPIAELRKNAREVVRVALRTFKNSCNIDLRVYTENGKEYLTPTAKGLSIKPSMLWPIINALESAERTAVAEGLMQRGDAE